MQIHNGTYCVYIHTFPNGKVYVGITGDPPHRRWKSDGYGYHSQRLIYNAIKKYGWDNVEHEIVASNLTKEEACNFEMLLIRAFKSTDHRFGYNIDNGGFTNGKHSPETLQKISMSMKKAWGNGTYQEMSKRKKDLYLGANNPVARSVICVETGEMFPTISSAAKAVNVSRQTISSCARGCSKSGGGFHWKYA